MSDSVTPGEDIVDVATALDLLALCLSTGVSSVAALDAVAHISGPVVRSHLTQVATALKWGLDPSQAWSLVPDVWRPAHQALALAASTGAAPGALLRDAAAGIRLEEEARLEAAAARLSVWLVVPLGLCFLPAFFCIAVLPTLIALGREVMTQ